MIEVTGLVKKYGEQLAVDQLSFTLESGRIYGLLGANGAGKSTTMNIITGYLGATAGDVVINGKNILDEPEAAKRQIGYLPEIPPLYPETKVTEYLQFAMGLKGLHKERIAPHLQELLEKVQLEDVKDRLIRNLSKGYKQRVGLAEALIGWPPIIILDEPTVGLDPQQIIGIRQLIAQLGEKHTVILSSHILAEVQEICDHILVIQQGKLIASESTEDLLALMNPSQGLELVVEGEEKQVSDILSSVPNIQKQMSDSKEISCLLFWQRIDSLSRLIVRLPVSIAKLVYMLAILTSYEINRKIIRKIPKIFWIFEKFLLE